MRGMEPAGILPLHAERKNMLSLQITDLKAFTALLFSKDAFDRFLFREGEFVTAFTTELDGRINKSFFAGDDGSADASAPSESCMSWSEIRPFCLSLIKGNRLPVSFRIILITSSENTASIVKRSGFQDCPVTSLSINLIYAKKELYLTTGAAYSGFSLNKSLEDYWDKAVTAFLDSKEISYVRPQQ